MSHSMILLIIVLGCALNYVLGIRPLKKPEEFLSFDEHYVNMVNKIVKPNNYSRFKYFNEFKL